PPCSRRSCGATIPPAVRIKRMNRRAFVTGLGTVLVAPRVAEAQPPGKIPRIGFIAPTAAPSGPESAVGILIDGLRQGLMEHGYVEGRTIVIEYRWAAGKFERLPDLAADLVRHNVDVIVAATTSAARAAKQATATIPIVMSPVGDPVDAGLVV